jgi:hypothetical protein
MKGKLIGMIKLNHIYLILNCTPFVTNNFTIRDLLTHRSGLKDVSGGTLWYHSDYSREDIIKA